MMFAVKYGFTLNRCQALQFGAAKRSHVKFILKESETSLNETLI